MKKSIILICAALSMAACSTDGENEETMESSSPLLGIWNMTDVRFSEDPTDTSLNLADEIVDRLAEEDCFLATFTFNADGTVISEDSVDFIEVNIGVTGLDVSCPDESSIENGQWSLDGNQLTLTTENQEETITIQLDGDTLIISGDEINAGNFAGAEAVFTRQ